jgi:hypothetical protein
MYLWMYPAGSDIEQVLSAVEVKGKGEAIPVTGHEGP